MVHRNAGWRGSASSAGNTRGLNEEDSPRPERAAGQRLKAVRSGTPAARRCRPLEPRRGSVRRGGSAAAGARASPWSASPGRGHGTPRSSDPAAQQPGTGPPPATARRGGQDGSARRRRAGKKGEHRPRTRSSRTPSSRTSATKRRRGYCAPPRRLPATANDGRRAPSRAQHQERTRGTSRRLEPARRRHFNVCVQRIDYAPVGLTWVLEQASEPGNVKTRLVK